MTGMPNGLFGFWFVFCWLEVLLYTVVIVFINGECGDHPFPLSLFLYCFFLLLLFSYVPTGKAGIRSVTEYTEKTAPSYPIIAIKDDKRKKEKHFWRTFNTKLCIVHLNYYKYSIYMTKNKSKLNARTGEVRHHPFLVNPSGELMTLPGNKKQTKNEKKTTKSQ